MELETQICLGESESFLFWHCVKHCVIQFSKQCAAPLRGIFLFRSSLSHYPCAFEAFCLSECESHLPLLCKLRASTSTCQARRNVFFHVAHKENEKKKNTWNYRLKRFSNLFNTIQQESCTSDSRNVFESSFLWPGWKLLREKQE